MPKLQFGFSKVVPQNRNSGKLIGTLLLLFQKPLQPDRKIKIKFVCGHNSLKFLK